MVYLLLIQYTVSLYLSYRAYSAFKDEYVNQHQGGMSSGYQPLFGQEGPLRNMSRYDDPERNGGGGRSYMVSGPGMQRGLA
jgi:hypothetical protein